MKTVTFLKLGLFNLGSVRFGLIFGVGVFGVEYGLVRHLVDGRQLALLVDRHWPEGARAHFGEDVRQVVRFVLFLLRGEVGELVLDRRLLQPPSDWVHHRVLEFFFVFLLVHLVRDEFFSLLVVVVVRVVIAVVGRESLCQKAVLIEQASRIAIT
jgi:hypothetical protein